MIQKASHHPVIYPFFGLYTLLKLKITFRKIIIRGNYMSSDKPILLISNHISWWDGFWAWYLNHKVFRHRFWFMMLDEQLRRHSFFNRTGGFSVKKNSRSILESIDYAAGLLSEKNNLVLIFPEGRIGSMHKNDFIFEKGTGRIAGKSAGTASIIFLASIIDYGSSPKPFLFMYFVEYTNEKRDYQQLQEAYKKFYGETLETHLQSIIA